MAYTTFNGASIVPMPAYPPPREISLAMNDTVAITASPFTRQSQVQQWPMGDYWDGQISLQPLVQANVQPWLAFLASLRGVANVFQVGNPLAAAPQGTAGNKIENAGFESNETNSVTIADDWIVDALTPSVTPGYSTGYCHSGSACQLLRWEPSSVLNGSAQTILYSTQFSVIPGQTVYFGGWASILSSAPLPNDAVLLQRISLRFFSASGATISESIIDYQAIGNGVALISRPWTYSSASAVVPAGATTVALLVASYDVSGVTTILPTTGLAADMYFDDVFAGFDLPVISGALNAGATYINTRSWRPNGANLLLPGDNFQLGYRLHIVAGSTAVSSDGSGNATFEIWPSLRETQADGAQLILNNATGLFRLADNKRSYTVDYTKVYPLAFKIMEAR